MDLTSTPAYPKKFGGACIVAGGGPDVLIEIADVRNHYGPIPMIAVNGMATKIAAFAFVTSHGSLIPSVYRPPAAMEHHVYPSDQRVKDCPEADYVWRGGKGLAVGTSSLPAVLIAKAIGFTEVVVCGVPLQKTGYVRDYLPGHPLSEFDDGPHRRQGLLNERRAAWARVAAAGLLQGVRSMSGATREILGAPQFVEERAA